MIKYRSHRRVSEVEFIGRVVLTKGIARCLSAVKVVGGGCTSASEEKTLNNGLTFGSCVNSVGVVVDDRRISPSRRERESEAGGEKVYVYAMLIIARTGRRRKVHLSLGLAGVSEKRID